MLSSFLASHGRYTYVPSRSIPDNAPEGFHAFFRNLADPDCFLRLVEHVEKSPSYRGFDGMDPIESVRHLGELAEDLLFEAMPMARRDDAVNLFTEIDPILHKANAIQRRLPFRGWTSVYNTVWAMFVGLKLQPIREGITPESFLEEYVRVTEEQAERMMSLEQGTEEWLLARMFRASGSTILKFVGFSDYKNIPDIDDAFDDFCVDKFFGFTKSNEFMSHGSITEDHARDVYEQAMYFATGGRLHVEERGFMVRPETGGWCGASPDGIIFLRQPNPKLSKDAFDAIHEDDAITAKLDDPDTVEDHPRCKYVQRRMLLEIKCPAYWITTKPSTYPERRKYQNNRWGGIPDAYYAQIQYLSALESTETVSDRARIRHQHFVIYLPNRTQVLLYQSNPTYQKGLMRVAQAMYYGKFVPLAIQFLRGELPFGMLRPMDKVTLRSRMKNLDSVTGGIDMVFSMKAEAERLAQMDAEEEGEGDDDGGGSDPEPAKKRSRVVEDESAVEPDIDDDDDDDDDKVVRAATEAEISYGHHEMNTETRYDRFVWKSMLDNKSVLSLRKLFSDMSTAEQKTMLACTSKLPNYLYEHSERGEALFRAFVAVVEAGKLDQLKNEITAIMESTSGGLGLKRELYDPMDAKEGASFTSDETNVVEEESLLSFLRCFPKK